MNGRFTKRVGTLFASSALILGTSFTIGSTEAAAAAQWTFEKGSVSSDGDFNITAFNNGTFAGAMQWNADPSGSTPGDAFRVLDRLADGWGVEATMISPSTGRKATTRGHNAPYTSSWNSGNLTEGSTVYIQLCAVKGDSTRCGLAYSGRA
ncbi:hypothetical protein AB0E81_28235 [Streptomyces sp. NPDC033538]|uniref:hypothetical protein n=1 Tax=Streptomyces sp. NPDC033538 TaxID=3155367 RepID=UPI0033C6DF29